MELLTKNLQTYLSQCSWPKESGCSAYPSKGRDPIFLFVPNRIPNKMLIENILHAKRMDYVKIVCLTSGSDSITIYK